MSADTMFKGKDVAEAIDNACKSLNVSQEELKIEVIETGSSGIFGLCRKKSLIKVTLKKKTEQTASKKPAKSGHKKTATQQDRPSGKKAASPSPEKKEPPHSEKTTIGKPQAQSEKSPQISVIADTLSDPAHSGQAPTSESMDTAREYILRMLDLMGFPSEVSISQQENSIYAHISGDHVQDIIGPDGRNLDSLQYLVRKMLNKKFSYKITLSLDAGDFRANRKKDLKKLGLKLAEEVKEMGKTRSISSLNPSERRIVHLALQDDKEIRSRSVGEGLFKKVLIYQPGKGKKLFSKKHRGNKQAQAKKTEE